MGGYAVDPGALQAVDVSLSALAADARAALAVVEAEAAGVLWHGPAAARFRAGWAEWHAGAGALIDALHELALAVGASGAGYRATDDAVRAGVAATSA